jgi:hypothetical protein
MNPENPVVKLCVEGMRAEAERRPEDARALFMQAWDARTDDYEACVAAHFVARQQDDPREALRWNELALHHAGADGSADGGERVREFYPSLYLNLGFAYEVLGELNEAKCNYELAWARLGNLPQDAYGEMVRQAVTQGMERVNVFHIPPGSAVIPSPAGSE